ncbi:MAG: DUF1772 domain-containing protein [Actinomycetota bacterium]
MPDVLTVHLMATSAYAGFQWTIRVVAYPQLAEVPRPAFTTYLAAYQRRVTYLVGPLFAALLLTTGLVALDSAVTAVGRVLAVLLLGVVLGATTFAAVPQHSRLSAGWDAAAHRRLLTADTVRVVAATLDAGLALVLLSP